MTLFLLGLCLLAFFTFWQVKPVQAQENESAHTRNIITNNKQHEYSLSPAMIKYQTKEDISDARKIHYNKNLKAINVNPTETITRLNLDDQYEWFSFDVVNRSRETFWRIDFGSNFMGRFGLFDDIQSAAFYNDPSTPDRRIILSKDGYIKLLLPINQKSQIYLGFKNSKGTINTIPFKLISPSFPTNTSNTMFFFLAIFSSFGFFFAAIAFLKNSYGYLHFTAYYMALTFLLFIQNKFIVAPPSLILGSYIIPFMILLTAITGLLSARIFWKTEDDDNTSFSNTLSYGFIGLCFIIFVAGIFIPFDPPVIQTVFLIGPSIAISVLIPLISIARSQQGHNEAMPFMLGWFVTLFGACITMLTLSGVMEPVATAINAYWYSIIPQAILFIFAVKMKLLSHTVNTTMSKTLEISETDSIARLRRTKENTEQERLLKVIEQERRVMSELRKSEARRTDEMRKAKEDADLANKAKSAFLAVVTHEIRTPMTGIMGMVRLLLDSNLTKDQNEYAQTIQESSDAMLALLNDILDFEKIEQGKMSFENISFDIHRLVNGVATLMSGHAAQKGIELRTKIGEDLPKYVMGDPTRLRQILLNLTGNAVKFTNEGHVTVTAEFMKEKTIAGNHKIYLGVTDSGIGIPKEAQKGLFTPFSQADDSIARQFGGTGLGLAISNGLVQGMGSTININSKEGEGSTFFFILEMASGDTEQKNTDSDVIKPATQEEKPAKILMVDNNEINQKVVAGFLQKTPHQIDMADSAEEALPMIQTSDYDLVLMDIELSGMNGDELTKQLRDSEQNKLQTLPIFALTGNIMPQHIERYKLAGMSGLLAKPIDIDKLKAVITNPESQFFKETKPNTAKGKTKPSFSGSKVTVTQKAQTVETASEEVFKAQTLDTLKDHISEKDLGEMLDDVITKTSEIIQGMNDALEAQDLEALSAKGHELKGMAGNFGLMEISDQAGQIEKKAKTETAENLTPLVQAMPEMQKRAQEALDHWLSN